MGAAKKPNDSTATIRSGTSSSVKKAAAPKKGAGFSSGGSASGQVVVPFPKAADWSGAEPMKVSETSSDSTWPGLIEILSSGFLAASSRCRCCKELDYFRAIH